MHVIIDIYCVYMKEAIYIYIYICNLAFLIGCTCVGVCVSQVLNDDGVVGLSSVEETVEVLRTDDEEDDEEKEITSCIRCQQVLKSIIV